MATTFQVAVNCEVGDKNIELAKLFEKKFRNNLGPLLWIHDFIDGTFGVSDAKKIDAGVKAQKAGKFNKLAARMNALPMSFELTPPKIAFGVGYGNASNNNVGYELEGQLLMNPIIGANVKLDILALGSKFKPWGAIIDALYLVSLVTDILSGGDLQLNYELYVELTAKILLVGDDAKNEEVKPANIHYSLLDKKLTKGGIALRGVLEGKIVANASLAFKVKKVSGKELTKHISKENKEKIFELGIEIKAESFISLTLGGSFGNGDNFDADFYFSGVDVKVKVKFGYKGKNETYKIIPYAEETFSVLKNKGEYK